MGTDLKLLAKDLVADHQYEEAIQVLQQAVAQGDVKAFVLLGDIYSDMRFEGHNEHRALVYYIRAQQNGLHLKKKILRLMAHDLHMPEGLTMDNLMSGIWMAFQKDPLRHLELVTLSVVSHMPGYEDYLKPLIKACEDLITEYPDAPLVYQSLAYLYGTFGTKKDVPRLRELQRKIVDFDASPESVDEFLRNGYVFEANSDPDESLWQYIDPLQETAPEKYWYFSGVFYFYANRFKEAIESFKVGADRFGGRSQVALGYCYMYGIGVAQDTAKAIELLTPLRQKYPIANMYLAHERMFREVKPKAFEEAVGIEVLLQTSYPFESMLNLLWIDVALLARFPIHVAFKRPVENCLNALLAEENADALALKGFLILLDGLDGFSKEEAETCFLKSHEAGSIVGTLGLLVASSKGEDLIVSGYLNIARHPEVNPQFRAICYLSSFMHALVIGEYNREKGAEFLNRALDLNAALEQQIEGLRILGSYLGKEGEPFESLWHKVCAYKERYPDYALCHLAEAVVQDRLAESIERLSHDASLVHDFVSIHMLALLVSWQLNDVTLEDELYQRADQLNPVTDPYLIAEAFSNRTFPGDLMADA